ncbi:MAG: hypothetical protein JSS02_19930 [Planctomycetes bacterium]|nr:hypothetical protein [Planctomycetota bacterium]
MAYTDDLEFIVLKLTFVADFSVAIWLTFSIMNRRAKPASFAAVAMFIVTLAVLVVTLPTWAQ